MRNRLKSFIDANIETIGGKVQFNFISNVCNSTGNNLPNQQRFYVSDQNTQLSLKETFDIDGLGNIVFTLITFTNGKALYEIKVEN
jgi:hypothetical protein